MLNPEKGHQPLSDSRSIPELPLMTYTDPGMLVLYRAMGLLQEELAALITGTSLRYRAG